MAKKKDAFIDIKYAGAVDLGEVLDEIIDNAQTARMTSEEPMSDMEDLHVTARVIDNLRCIVEDAEEKLRPHYEALDEIWDSRSKAKPKAKPKRPRSRHGANKQRVRRD